MPSIFGTSRVPYLEENVAGAMILLSDDEFGRLDIASKAHPEPFP